jgi:hypothetical protein
MDLDERRYYFTIPETGNPEGKVNDRYLLPVPFPRGLTVEEVRLIPGERVSEGKAFIPFTPTGMLFSFEIVLGEGEGAVYVIAGNSLTGDIAISRRDAR